ncbi:MAG: hypothetical protein P8X42_14530, partial [Calditrichaceae bacterium]
EDLPDYIAWEWGFKSRVNTDFEETYKIKFIAIKKGNYNIIINIVQSIRNEKEFHLEGEIDSLEVLEYELFFTTDTTKDVYFRKIESTPSLNLYIESITPKTIYAGNPSFNLQVKGKGFLQGSTIQIDDVEKNTNL